MAIEYMFFDNQEVTADMMNDAVKKVFSGGITSYADNEEYRITKLNNMYYSSLYSGIVPDADDTLKVSLNEEKTEAVIKDGTCIFADGSHATVSGTEIVSLLTEGTSFISLCSDKMRNCVYACVTDTEPTDNILNQIFYVVLASVTDGEVTDLRKYAKGKFASQYASDYGLSGYREFKDVTHETEELVFYSDNKIYNYMTVWATDQEYKEPGDGYCVSVINLVTGETVSSHPFISWSYKDREVSYNLDKSIWVAVAANNNSDYIVYGKLSTDEDKYTLKLTWNEVDDQTLNIKIFLY